MLVQNIILLCTIAVTLYLCCFLYLKIPIEAFSEKSKKGWKVSVVRVYF